MRNGLRITWLLVCLGLAPAAMGAARVALVIGNSAYQNIRPLSNPVSYTHLDVYKRQR